MPINLPKHPLSDIELKHYVKTLKIPFFRGVFMRNSLPKKINKNECGIINLDSYEGPGTHWTAYHKKGNQVSYFDSYGNLRPPSEAVTYFNSSGYSFIKYNHYAYQSYNTYNCGHLCIEFLYNNK